LLLETGHRRARQLICPLDQPFRWYFVVSGKKCYTCGHGLAVEPAKWGCESCESVC